MASSAIIPLVSFSAAQTEVSGSFSIQVTVPAVADIAFPEGSAFYIEVPEPASPEGATIRPVRIPFTVRGNAQAAVSALPGAFLQIAEGHWLGAALGPDGGTGRLGYDVVVQFPVPSPDDAGLPGHGGFGTWPDRDNLASLPGTDGAGTPPLAADMSAQDFEAYGTIHIVARRFWTHDGSDAAAGNYAGAVEVTVVAHDD
jgi:hypothetical protein